MSDQNSTHPGFDCTVDTCPLDESYWDYRPSLAQNGIMIALFGLSMILHAAQGVRYKTWGFMASMVLGCIAEIIGYGGRIWAYSDYFAKNAFLIQICCLTIAPAFLSAGIYLCLSRIVIIFGEDISRIRPKSYTYIFITCDFISLCLQGAGGGLASTLSQDNKDPSLGNNIMLAGLSFQVFTLVLFIALCAEYAHRVHTTTESLSRIHARLRASRKFRGFLVALALSTLLILIRSIYRVIEMAQGWEGELRKNEILFFVLEGVMIVPAVLVLNAFHPGWCFSIGYAERNNGGEKGEEGLDGEER